MANNVQSTKTNQVVKKAMTIALRDVRTPKVVREGVVKTASSVKR